MERRWRCPFRPGKCLKIPATAIHPVVGRPSVRTGLIQRRWILNTGQPVTAARSAQTIRPQSPQERRENRERAGETMSVGETAYPALEETKSVLEGEEEKSPADNVYFGTVSDNSDIVTLEPPKLEEIGNQGEAKIVTEAWRPEDFNVYILTASSCIFISV